MIIKYDKKTGRILVVSKGNQAKRAENSIIIKDSDLPKDFTNTYAFGKYLVKKEKLVKKPNFKMPRRMPRRVKVEP